MVMEDSSTSSLPVIGQPVFDTEATPPASEAIENFKKFRTNSNQRRERSLSSITSPNLIGRGQPPRSASAAILDLDLHNLDSKVKRRSLSTAEQRDHS